VIIEKRTDNVQVPYILGFRIGGGLHTPSPDVAVRDTQAKSQGASILAKLMYNEGFGFLYGALMHVGGVYA
jgi:hypothetical protein